MAALCHPLLVAVSTLHGHRMDVPRGPRPRWLLDVAQRKIQSYRCDSANDVTAARAGPNQHRTTSGAAHKHVLLGRTAARPKLPLPRGGVRASAVAGNCTSTPRGIHCLS